MDKLLARRTFRVHGLVWKIEYVEASALEVLTDCGETLSATQTIRINREMSQEMQFCTLCHELQHAAGMGEDAAEHAEVFGRILLENDLTTPGTTLESSAGG